MRLNNGKATLLHPLQANIMNTADHYSDDEFWQKIKKFALKAGKEVIEKALWLYYAAQRPETPTWAKTIIFGALAYFILPLDVIPDVIPVAGYSDDLGALAAAIGMVSMYITAEIKEQATQKLQQWFS
jgi:uncharacterized membrane protein YkvA (DUF1232 family)